MPIQPPTTEQLLLLLEDACKATLLFHQSNLTHRSRQEWRRITGCDDFTTRVLCDFVRLAQARAEDYRREIPSKIKEET